MICPLLVAEQFTSDQGNMQKFDGRTRKESRAAMRTDGAKLQNPIIDAHHDTDMGRDVGPTTLGNAQPDFFCYQLIVEDELAIEFEVAFFPPLQKPKTIGLIRSVVKTTCAQTLLEIEERSLSVHGRQNNELVPLHIMAKWDPKTHGGTEECPLVIKAQRQAIPFNGKHDMLYKFKVQITHICVLLMIFLLQLIG
jgi:hypothetical protein